MERRELRNRSLASGRRAAWLGLVALAFAAPSAMAFQQGVEGGCPTCRKPWKGHTPHGQGVTQFTQYGGYQGFGLNYHLGYGYGGRALGVGQEGGYPFYAGPGYPHAAPPLQRFGRIAPFAFNPGPGGPTADCPLYFGLVGPLVLDPGVVQVDAEPGEVEPSQSYGPFTGLVPYDESTFAAATTAAAQVSTNPAPVPSRPDPGAAPAAPAASRLGADYEAFQDAQDRGVKITKLTPGGAAERAGLKVGEVILSINGYLSHTPELTAWILKNASPAEPLVIQSRPTKGAAVKTSRIDAR